MHIWIYPSNRYPFPNFVENLASALPYASASTYLIPFLCNVDLQSRGHQRISLSRGCSKGPSYAGGAGAMDLFWCVSVRRVSMLSHLSWLLGFSLPVLLSSDFFYAMMCFGALAEGDDFLYWTFLYIFIVSLS